MSVWIGDLMAMAEEPVDAGAGKKRGKRRESAGKGDGEVDGRVGRVRQDQERVSAHKGRELEGDSINLRRGRGEDKAGDGGESRSVSRASTDGTTLGARTLDGRKFPPKQMGELWELDFLRKALGMGMIVSKPWGDSYRYDFVVDAGEVLNGRGMLWRVQVRATRSRFGARGYAVHASVYKGRKIVGLTEKDIDAIVAYIAPRDIWYVVPVRAFVPRKNLWFYPDGSRKGAMFEKFRDAWWIITGER